METPSSGKNAGEHPESDSPQSHQSARWPELERAVDHSLNRCLLPSIYNVSPVALGPNWRHRLGSLRAGFAMCLPRLVA